MNQIPLGVLFGALAVLILVSAFFSAAEIGLMTLNRYRLRHLADSGHRGARMALNMLAQPDRLLGVILLGNNFANIAASAVATVIGMELYGDVGIAIATGILTFLILIFGEVAPKTVAALYPERIGLTVVYLLQPLLKVLYPLVWAVNSIANRFLRLLGVSLAKRSDHLSTEELKAVVTEAGALIPESHQTMLLAILDLEKITVDDVMVPRRDIEGVDIDADWDDIVRTFASSRYTRLPAYCGSLDNVVGMVHLRRVLNLMHSGKFDRNVLQSVIAEPYFIPQGTSLNRQLVNFKNTRRRIGLVVDEYGDLRGLVTLEEILEEIVGDFTTPMGGSIGNSDIREDSGSYLVKGATAVRDVNRRLGWQLPTDGPKTINGLITEYLEDLPVAGTSLMLGNYETEIVRTRGTGVQMVRMRAAQVSEKGKT